MDFFPKPLSGAIQLASAVAQDRVLGVHEPAHRSRVDSVLRARFEQMEHGRKAGSTDRGWRTRSDFPAVEIQRDGSVGRWAICCKIRLTEEPSGGLYARCNALAECPAVECRHAQGRDLLEALGQVRYECGVAFGQRTAVVVMQKRVALLRPRVNGLVGIAQILGGAAPQWKTALGPTNGGLQEVGPLQHSETS